MVKPRPLAGDVSGGELRLDDASCGSHEDDTHLQCVMYDGGKCIVLLPIPLHNWTVFIYFTGNGS